MLSDAYAMAMWPLVVAVVAVVAIAVTIAIVVAVVTVAAVIAVALVVTTLVLVVEVGDALALVLERIAVGVLQVLPAAILAVVRGRRRPVDHLFIDADIVEVHLTLLILDKVDALDRLGRRHRREALCRSENDMGVAIRRRRLCP